MRVEKCVTAALSEAEITSEQNKGPCQRQGRVEMLKKRVPSNDNDKDMGASVTWVDLSV